MVKESNALWTWQQGGSRSNLRFLRADAKYHVNKLQEKGEEPIELGGFHNKRENNRSYPASHAVNTNNDQLLTWAIIKVGVANAK